MRRLLDPGIRLIAFFELLKGTLVAIGALGLLTMLHKDVGNTLNEAVLRLRVDPDNRYIHMLITQLSGATPRQLEAVSAGSFLYAALRYVEGLGLSRVLGIRTHMACITSTPGAMRSGSRCDVSRAFIPEADKPELHSDAVDPPGLKGK